MGLGILWIVVRIHLVSCVREILVALIREFSHRRVQVFVPTDLARMEVKLVALEAKEGFILCKKVVGNGSMGGMANSAVFHHRCVFKDKGALLGGMAGQTEIVYPFISLQSSCRRTMGIVTVRAAHLPFPDRMVGRILDLGLDVRMTTIAAFRLRLGQQMFACRRVDLVALHAAHLV
jgi:hypothetical protein